MVRLIYLEPAQQEFLYWALMICRLRPFADNPPVCCPRVRHGHSVYRWRSDRICSHAFNSIHSCRSWVRIAIISRLVELVDHPNLVPITCSIGAMYLYSGDTIRKNLLNGIETALGESNYAFCFQVSRSAQLQMGCSRYFHTIVPILTPEICQGSDSGDAYYHVGGDGRILRRCCI
jgi:hypothetical protein